MFGGTPANGMPAAATSAPALHGGVARGLSLLARGDDEVRCGWPAFDKCYDGAVVHRPEDDGTDRIEITCGNCGGHLGHVFVGEGFTETGQRHCVNSRSLQFVKAKAATPAPEVALKLD